MNLLIEPWIPVRDNSGSGEFRLISLEELLCADDTWWVSLPRDDLELACIQLLVCMVQIMFLPENDDVLRMRLRQPLTSEELEDGIEPCKDWFDLNHPTQPFMQTRGVTARNPTPIQKLLVGLPEGNNHAFFNKVGEVKQLSAPIAAIALFNQASNAPGFGGGFKDSLRGKAPITSLVKGRNLRETVWRNVSTSPRIRQDLPEYKLDLTKDQPTWIIPIHKREKIKSHEIGLVRGLFWQPARVELIKSPKDMPCDILGDKVGQVYVAFLKEKFNFTVEGVWPHPHGAMIAKTKKGTVEWKFASFNTNAPAWTWLSEFIIPSPLSDDIKEGTRPATPIVQVSEISPSEPLHLIVGGYHAKQASVIERRHELFTLAEGWEEDNRGRVKTLVETGKIIRNVLRGKLWYAGKGDLDRGMKGIGVPLHETGEKLYYVGTETVFHETLRERLTFKEWQRAKYDFTERISNICRHLFDEITNPYAMKPELLPIIAWTRRNLNADLAKLTGGKNL